VAPVFGAEVGFNSVRAASQTTLAVTTTAIIPAGSLIVICAANTAAGASNVLVSGINDLQGNTYLQAVDQGDAAGPNNNAIWYSYTGNAVPSGTVVTTTWAAAITAAIVNILYATATDLSGPLDKTQKSTGSSTAATTGATAALSQPSEIAFASLMSAANGAVTISGTTAGFTNLTRRASGTATTGNLVMFPAYQVVAATAALTYAGTLSATQVWDGVIATFRAPGVLPNLMLPPRTRP